MLDSTWKNIFLNPFRMKEDPEQKLKLHILIEIRDTDLYDYLLENYVKLNNRKLNICLYLMLRN